MLNLTINATTKVVTIDYLKGSTVTGTDYISFYRLRDEPIPTDKAGWWFDRFQEDEHNRKLLFADIVNLNGSPIGATTQAQVTALLVAAISV